MTTTLYIMAAWWALVSFCGFASMRPDHTSAQAQVNVMLAAGAGMSCAAFLALAHWW